jgi:hypothetical protein
MATSGSEIYAEFIEAELKAENDRRESVHTRASAAITSAVALITLVVGVFGFLVGKSPGFPAGAKPYLVLAVLCLLFAGACAVAAQFPLGQKFVSDNTIEKMLDAHRGDTEDVARDAVAYINAVSLLSLRKGTTRKVLLLFASGGFQIIAMLAIGLCISAVVTGQPQPCVGPPNAPTSQPQRCGPPPNPPPPSPNLIRHLLPTRRRTPNLIRRRLPPRPPASISS